MSAKAVCGCGSPGMSDEEWRKTLTPEQYRVLRQHGTEYAGGSPLNHEKRQGTYHCAGCGNVLFTSSTKYDSGSGWPSFWDAVVGSVATSTDYNIGYARTEVHCAKCGGHLGHIFDDGPPPTGKRHCINGVSLKFSPSDERKGD